MGIAKAMKSPNGEASALIAIRDDGALVEEYPEKI